jgi:hypothetical protein
MKPMADPDTTLPFSAGLIRGLKQGAYRDEPHLQDAREDQGRRACEPLPAAQAAARADAIGGLDNLNRPEIACAVEAIEIEENLALASLGSGIL